MCHYKRRLYQVQQWQNPLKEQRVNNQSSTQEKTVPKSKKEKKNTTTIIFISRPPNYEKVISTKRMLTKQTENKIKIINTKEIRMVKDGSNNLTKEEAAMQQ